MLRKGTEEESAGIICGSGCSERKSLLHVECVIVSLLFLMSAFFIDGTDRVAALQWDGAWGYLVNGQGEAIIYECGDDGPVITIPSLLSNTYPVVAIGYEAFRNQGLTMISVTIPSSVKAIDLAAFSSCSALSSITIPDSVETIGDYAFSSCHSMKSATIGNGVTTIGECAFGGCIEMTSVTIGNSVTTIGQAAFSRCKSLASVTVPASVTTIGVAAFSDNDGLQDIFVDSNNPSYCSVDGVLYDKSQVTLVQYPAGKAVGVFLFNGIPGSVTTIWSSAFSGCIYMSEVAIPDHIEVIEDYAFEFCTVLTKVSIGNGMKTIGYGAFGSCSSLEELYFYGLIAPTVQGAYWIEISLTTHGHAYKASDFQDIFYGLPMKFLVTVGFSQEGVGVSAPDSVLAVDGTTYWPADLPISFTWMDQSSHSFSWSSVVNDGSGTRHKWQSTSGLSSGQSGTVVVSTDGFVVASYGTEYRITVTSAHDNPTQSSWVNSGDDFAASVTSPTEIVENERQWVCTGHKIDGGYLVLGTSCTITGVDTPHSIEFQWKEQFYLTVISAYDTPAGSGWFDTQATATAMIEFGTVEISGVQYVFSGWTINDVPAGNTLSQQVVMDGPKTAVANWVAVIAWTPGPDNPPGSPQSRTGSYEYQAPGDGTWTGRFGNDGVANIRLTVIDVTGGGVEVFSQFIKFANLGAFPTGEALSNSVHMTAGRVYMIQITPYGGRGSLQIFDEFAPDVGSSSQNIGATGLGLLGIQVLMAIGLCYIVTLELGRIMERQLPVPKAGRRAERKLSIQCEVLGLK